MGQWEEGGENMEITLQKLKLMCTKFWALKFIIFSWNDKQFSIDGIWGTWEAWREIQM